MPHCATRHLLQSFTHESMQMPETGSRVTILTLFGIYLLELTPLWGDPEDAPILRNQEREQLPLDTHTHPSSGCEQRLCFVPCTSSLCSMMIWDSPDTAGNSTESCSHRADNRLHTRKISKGFQKKEKEADK